MGIILNPRGTAGSGKTELVRRILTLYGSKPRPLAGGAEGLEPLYRPGRHRPFGYRLRHPYGGRPLVVVGHYEVTSGGCDTIRAADGGLKEAAGWASSFARSGHDVVMEGLRLSSDIEHTSELAQVHDLRVLRLRTPVQQSVRQLIARRRARRDAVPGIVKAVAAEHELVEAACKRLREHLITVEELSFDQALARAQSLLGLIN